MVFLRAGKFGLVVVIGGIWQNPVVLFVVAVVAAAGGVSSLFPLGLRL